VRLFKDWLISEVTKIEFQETSQKSFKVCK